MKLLYVALLAASALFVTGTAQAGPFARHYVATHYRPSIIYVTPYVYTVPVQPVDYSYPGYSYAPYGQVSYPTYAYSYYRGFRR